MPEPKLMTQRVEMPDGTIKEIRVKSIGAEILARAAERKARQKARKKAKQSPPPAP